MLIITLKGFRRKSRYFLAFFQTVFLLTATAVQAQDTTLVPGKQDTVIVENNDSTILSKTNSSQAASLQTDEAGGSLPALPDFTPPSPDVAALIKVGLGNLDKSTGAVTSSIPLYELKLNDYTFPVSLNYYSQGSKPEEMCSVAGYGWALQAGGAISRDLQGLPDEAVRHLAMPGDNYELTLPTQTNLNYFTTASRHDLRSDLSTGYDTQPDVFSFSFCGYSGKFILDSLLRPVLITYSNIKISLVKNGTEILRFVITTPDGIQYYFGDDAYEEIATDGGPFVNFPKSVFLLNKIVLPNSEYINLYYEPRTITTGIGIAEQWAFGAGGDGSSFCNCPGSGVSTVPANGTPTVTYKRRIYQSQYVISIAASNGVTLSFLYGEGSDQTNIPRLTGFYANTRSQNQQVNLKSYVFEYLDGGKTYNADVPFSRYYLTAIKEKPSVAGGTKPPIVYRFEYNDPAYTNSIFSQDLFGFANGQANSTLLIANNFVSGFAGANRDPSSGYSAKGLLSKISYPTGGTEEFFYEGNTVAKTVTDYNSYPQTITSVYSQTNSNPTRGGFVATYTGTMYSEIRRYNMPLDEGPSGNKVAFISVTDNSGGPGLVITLFRGIPIQYDSFQVIANHGYTININVPQYTTDQVGLILTRKINTQNTTTINVETSGVRLASIRKTDPFTMKTTSRYFTYAAIDDDLKLSTAIVPAVPSYSTITTYPKDCSGNGIYCVYSLCKNLLLTSNSTYNLFNYNGSHIFYNKIIEADDPGYANGATETTFMPYQSQVSALRLYGDPMYFLPSENFPRLTGMPYIIKTFNGQLNELAEQGFKYEIVPTGQKVKAVAANKKFSLSFCSTGEQNIRDQLTQFDVTYYQYLPGWVRDTAVITTQFDNNGKAISATTAKRYGDLDNVLPVQIITTDSKNIQVVQLLKYPTDLTATPRNVYNDMVSKNILEPVVEASVQKNGVEQIKTTTTYKAWITSGITIYKPETILYKAAPSATQEERIRFNAYDRYGNVLEVQQTNGIKQVYLWGYHSQFPVAKIAGSNYNTAKAIINQAILDSDVTSDEDMRTELGKLRTNLQDAFVTTYTYAPFIGITSETTPSGYTTNYNYDVFNRLKSVKDMDGNVLKAYDYNYQTKANCTNTTPDWQPAGTSYCDIDDNNNNTGKLLQQQIDMNICSDTYLQYKTAVVGTGAPGCPVVPNCTGTNMRVVNGVCERGTKVYTRSQEAGPNTYVCTYHYEWSDSFHSINYTENHVGPCPIF